jgi:hypothetical protein
VLEGVFDEGVLGGAVFGEGVLDADVPGEGCGFEDVD